MPGLSLDIKIRLFDVSSVLYIKSVFISPVKIDGVINNKSPEHRNNYVWLSRASEQQPKIYIIKIFKSPDVAPGVNKQLTFLVLSEMS